MFCGQQVLRVALSGHGDITDTCNQAGRRRTYDVERNLFKVLEHYHNGNYVEAMGLGSSECKGLFLDVLLDKVFIDCVYFFWFDWAIKLIFNHVDTQ
jgi:hypothetical protein